MYNVYFGVEVSIRVRTKDSSGVWAWVCLLPKDDKIQMYFELISIKCDRKRQKMRGEKKETSSFIIRNISFYRLYLFYLAVEIGLRKQIVETLSQRLRCENVWIVVVVAPFVWLFVYFSKLLDLDAFSLTFWPSLKFIFLYLIILCLWRLWPPFYPVFLFDRTAKIIEICFGKARRENLRFFFAKQWTQWMAAVKQ